MEPRSAERGNDRLDDLGGWNLFGFNGATLSRTWKQEFVLDRLYPVQAASMEPRSAERGN